MINYAVQADGSIAWLRDAPGPGGTYVVEWASPAAPAPHPVLTGRGNAEVRIASDLIAVAPKPDFAARNPDSAIQVFDKSGRLMATQPDPAPVGSWDFDGHALTRSEFDCATVQVLLRKLADLATTFPAQPCGTPTAESNAVLHGSDLRFRWRCPASARLGCVGKLRAEVQLRGCRRGCRRAAGVDAFWINADRSVRQTLTETESLVSWLRRNRHRQPSLILQVTAKLGLGQQPPTRRARLRLALLVR